MREKTIKWLGECVKHHRIFADISLETMGKALIICKATLSNIENGKHSFSVQTYFKILNFFNKTESEFWIDNPITGIKNIQVYTNSKGETVNPELLTNQS